MKLTKFINYFFLLFLNFFIVACGGGGGGGGSSGGDSSSTPTNNGMFIDSAVKGLTYSTSTQSGQTNSSGTFSYKSGETVSFYIGNILIGSASGQSVITPIDIVSGGNIDNATVLNIARVLQTFDSDRNVSNGITLVDAAENFSSELGVDFSSNAFITNLINKVNTTEVNAGRSSLIEINATTAKAHLQDTFSSLVSGNDPLDSNQWYLTDLNITAVHADYNGSSANGSIIQIVDTGIDPIHEDIFANLDLDKSYNAETGTPLNCTPDSGESHGTQCAGIASARGYNNKGIRGINPLGKVVGFKFHTIDATSFTYDQAQLETAWISGSGANDITISSNSWGSCSSTTTFEEDILKLGSENLRNEKGRVYVIAGGNERADSGSCPKGSANLTYTANNQYIIAVAALKQNNTYAAYSNPGSNILISAYGDNVYTTDLNDSYGTFSGTSAATPMVSGAIGLILEACPTLTYRDVKYVLAKTAIQVDTKNSTWVTNGANLKHSIDYGYGRIDVASAISMCSSGYTLLGAVSDTNTTENVGSTVPDNNATGLSTTINVGTAKTIEWVGVWFDASLDNLGEFEFYLESPVGTITKLLHNDSALASDNISNGAYNLRLSSVAFVDENSTGGWIVKVADRDANNQTNRTITNIKLQIVGH